MPAKSQVTVSLQIIFAMIPILNIWAFYRIGKLRLFVLFVVIPLVVMIFLLFMVIHPILFGDFLGIYSSNLETRFEYDPPQTVPPHMTPIEPDLTLGHALQITGVGFAVFSALFMLKWSRKWNKQFVN